MDIPLPVCHAIPFSPCQGTLDTHSSFLPVLRGKLPILTTGITIGGGAQLCVGFPRHPLALLPSWVAPSVLVGRDSLLYQCVGIASGLKTKLSV